MIMIATLALGAETPKAEALDSLIEKIKNGDMTALAALYEETRVAVYSFALTLLKSKEDAEDVLQEVYLCVAKSARLYQRKGKPMAWLMTMTKNLCFSKIRRRVNEVSLNRDLVAFDDVIRSAEDRITLKLCLKKLSDEERRIVILHAVSGLKHKEIAAVLLMNPATVGSKYARAIKKLEEELKKGGMLDERR